MSVSADSSFFPAPARMVAPYLFLVLIVFTVYGNIYDNAFLFDDGLLIQINSYLPGWNHLSDILTRSTTSGAHIAGGFFRPVQMFLYLLAYHAGDGSTWPFHLLNVLIHSANACLMYKLGTKLNFDPRGVFLAALVWAVHPLHTEAVTYMSATADPLFAFFCLSSIVVLLPDFTPRKILLMLPLFLLGLCSKETTAMLPLLVMSCLFFASPQRLNYRIYLRTLPLWAISLIFVYWRSHVPGFDGPQTYVHFYAMPQFATLKAYADHPLDRVYTFLATLPNYLSLLAYPTNLHMERSFPIYTSPWATAVITGAGLVLCSAAHIVYSTRIQRGMEFGWGLMWFAAAHAPDTGLLIPMNALFLEHWMYLPTIGLFLGIAQTIFVLGNKHSRLIPYAGAAAAIAFALPLSAKTYEQNKVWHDPASFYTNIFSNGVNSARAHNNLALYYSDKGQYNAAIDQFLLATTAGDTYAETRYNLALTYLRIGYQKENIDKAIANLERSLEIEPGFYRSYQTLGDIYSLLLHDKEKADAYHRRAAAILEQRQK